MNGLWQSVEERVEAYLHHRRRLGYKLAIEGAQLHRFARFAERQGHRGPLTLELALAWANASCTPLGPPRRLGVVRGLAKYCVLFEPETAVPACGLLGPTHRRLVPHIYTPEEIAALMAAAGQLAPPHGLRPLTMRTLFGLLAATGMRIGEALALRRQDVDLQRALVTVQRGKFAKARELPLHTSTTAALLDYSDKRDRQVALARDDAFFLFDDGRGVSYNQVLYAFVCLRRQLGWERSDGRHPRLHDLRHSFACQCLMRWYAKGVDVNWALPQLSTYLGHVKVSDTYWYLTAVPALMRLVAERFEHFTQEAAHHE